MKKVLFTFALLILPVMLLLSSCGTTKTEKKESSDDTTPNSIYLIVIAEKTETETEISFLKKAAAEKGFECVDWYLPHVSYTEVRNAIKRASFAEAKGILIVSGGKQKLGSYMAIISSMFEDINYASFNTELLSGTGEKAEIENVKAFDGEMDYDYAAKIVDYLTK